MNNHNQILLDNAIEAARLYRNEVRKLEKQVRELWAVVFLFAGLSLGVGLALVYVLTHPTTSTLPGLAS